jgi:hypothetical protein
LAALAGVMFILAYTPKHPQQELKVQLQGFINRRRQAKVSN